MRFRQYFFSHHKGLSDIKVASCDGHMVGFGIRHRLTLIKWMLHECEVDCEHHMSYGCVKLYSDWLLWLNFVNDFHKITGSGELTAYD